MSSSTSNSAAQNRSRGGASTPAFSYPSTPSASSLQLSNLITTPLTDVSSTYTSVTKICLHISQCIAVMIDGNSFILHERSFVRNASRILSALMTCIREHEDRRCRVVVARCLANFARVHFLKLRSYGYMNMCGDADISYSSHNYGPNNDADGSADALHVCSSRSSLEDECSRSTAVCLAECALASTDEGVIAAMIESLGILCTDCENDDLMTEVGNITGIYTGTSSSRSEMDRIGFIERNYDPSIDLQKQSLNALSTRIRQIAHLISLMKLPHQIARCIPFLSKAISYFYVVGFDGEEVISLIDDIVQSTFHVGMTVQNNPKLRHTCAVGMIRIVNFCSFTSWNEPLSRVACEVLLESLMSTRALRAGQYSKSAIRNLELGEETISLLALALIGLRGVKVSDRASILCRILERIYEVPLIDTKNIYGVESLPRVGLLCECALRIFADNSLPESLTEHYEILKAILSNDSFMTMFENRNLYYNESGALERCVADEFVAIFCSCASTTGNRLVCCVLREPSTCCTAYSVENF